MLFINAQSFWVDVTGVHPFFLINFHPYDKVKN